MKAINIILEDKEFVLLKKRKGKMSWRDFLLYKFSKLNSDREEEEK
jgi:hypothetical protein